MSSVCYIIKWLFKFDICKGPDEATSYFMLAVMLMLTIHSYMDACFFVFFKFFFYNVIWRHAGLGLFSLRKKRRKQTILHSIGGPNTNNIHILSFCYKMEYDNFAPAYYKYIQCMEQVCFWTLKLFDQSEIWLVSEIIKLFDQREIWLVNEMTKYEVSRLWM